MRVRMGLEVGRLLCSTFRKILDRQIALGADFTYWEGSGFLSHTFVLEGERLAVKSICVAFENIFAGS